MISNKGFIEDMSMVYNAIDTCSAICTWFEDNDVLTEEVFRTFMSAASKRHLLDILNFIEEYSKKL